MKATSALVTGGAGFIGSHLAEALVAEGVRTRVLDDLSVGKPQNVPSACDLIEGSVLDETALEEAIQGVDVVYHEAARVTIRGSVDHFFEDAETNLMGTLRLLQVASRRNVRRVVFASSMAVYADVANPQPIAESHPKEPLSPYGFAKLAAEQNLLLLGAKLGLEPVVLRYFNTFGTRQGFTPYVGVINIFIHHLLDGEPLTIFGDGQQQRDYVHVSDIVGANLRALSVDDAVGRVFNVGTGVGTTVEQLAMRLRDQVGAEVEIRYEPHRPEETRHSVADIRAAREVLGYEPETDLTRDIDELIDYVRDNR